MGITLEQALVDVLIALIPVIGQVYLFLKIHNDNQRAELDRKQMSKQISTNSQKLDQVHDQLNGGDKNSGV